MSPQPASFVLSSDQDPLALMAWHLVRAAEKGGAEDKRACLDLAIFYGQAAIEVGLASKGLSGSHEGLRQIAWLLGASERVFTADDIPLLADLIEAASRLRYTWPEPGTFVRRALDHADVEFEEKLHSFLLPNIENSL